MAYKLCPNEEITTSVPRGIASSLYTFPETPTTGFERGMISSSQTTRGVSTTGGWILNVSCMTAGQAYWVATEDVTNLPNRNQIGHAVEVVGNKLAIASHFDSFPSFVNFGSQFILDVTILGQLPENKSQL